MNALNTFLFLLCITVSVHAQTGHTASRTVTKTIPLTAQDVLSISVEKANVQLEGWDKDYAALKITFTATHPDKAIAEAELEYMHYALSREKRMIEVRNAFLLPSYTDKIQSRVVTVLELKVPFQITAVISNKYGDTELDGLSGKNTITLAFSDLVLKNISGTLNLHASYSEIRGEGLSYSSFISHDEESTFRLSLKTGTYQFNSKHSDLDLRLANIRSLTVNATHTDVTLQPTLLSSYNYQLVSREGKIFVPRLVQESVRKDNNQNQFSLMHAPAQPLISVKTTYNTITLQ